MSNPARPPAGALLARLDDISDPGALVRDFNAGEARYSLLLARRGDVVTAYENRCPHAGFPLERPDGRLLVQEGRYLLCAGHGASFSMADGACVAGPGSGRGLTPISISVSEGEIRMAQSRTEGL
ncbi:MAG: Rieske (2Fe-2S) protein [Hyphomonadaceae bacterium]